jgi:hypothetical protein
MITRAINGVIGAISGGLSLLVALYVWSLVISFFSVVAIVVLIALGACLKHFAH